MGNDQQLRIRVGRIEGSARGWLAIIALVLLLAMILL